MGVLVNTFYDILIRGCNSKDDPTFQPIIEQQYRQSLFVCFYFCY